MKRRPCSIQTETLPNFHLQNHRVLSCPYARAKGWRLVNKKVRGMRSPDLADALSAKKKPRTGESGAFSVPWGGTVTGREPHHEGGIGRAPRDNFKLYFLIGDIRDAYRVRSAARRRATLRSTRADIVV